MTAAPDARSIKADLIRTYDASALTRDERGEPDWRDDHRNEFTATLKDEARTRILEIGAGAGHSSAFFSAQGFAVVATDLSPGNVERCLAKGLEAHVADFANLGFSNRSFDALWAMSCLMHATDEDFTIAIDEMARVLTPGGLVVAGMWGGDGTAEILEDDVVDPPRFFAWRTDDHIRAAFGAAFVIEEFRTIDGPPDDPRDEHYQLVKMRKR
ncbi:MAG: class I SAM-dependent methyltransferase [Acidimicrobiia bacterium]